jgi:hypothetical protein
VGVSPSVDLLLVGSKERELSLPLTIDEREWNQWIILPIKYKDLSLDTRWMITVYYRLADEHKRFIAKAALPLFNEDG